MNEDSRLAGALVAFQAELKPVDKNAENPFFKSKYMTLSNVMLAVQPLLAKHKLAVTQLVSSIDGQTALRTRLLHESGEFVEDTMPLLLAKEDPQAQGSAVTYARRYALCALLGIVADEDDDGNKATQEYKPSAKKMMFATPKQIDWMRDEARRVSGFEHTEDVDKWLTEVLTIPPQKVPLTKVKGAVDRIKAQKEPVKPDPTPDDVEVTDQDLADLEAGKVPF